METVCSGGPGFPIRKGAPTSKGRGCQPYDLTNFRQKRCENEEIWAKSLRRTSPATLDSAYGMEGFYTYKSPGWPSGGVNFYRKSGTVWCDSYFRRSWWTKRRVFILTGGPGRQDYPDYPGWTEGGEFYTYRRPWWTRLPGFSRLYRR